MNEVVLDASAILAIVFDEPGKERLTAEILDVSVVSTVNLAEVQTKLIKKGFESEEAWWDAVHIVVAVEPFTADHAKIAGDLIAKAEPYGLSLGDRACLALAIALNAPVYTTEQLWKNLKLGVPIHVIR
ncbi:MAG: PIN domain-containing protein [Terracidiphilus sp.]